MVRQRIIILLCLSTTIGAVLYTYVIPEKYEATALVLVRPQENIVFTPATPGAKEVLNLPASGTSMRVDTPSLTYMEIIKSRAVTKKVVRMLDLDKENRVPSHDNFIIRTMNRIKGTIKQVLSATWSILKYGRVVYRDPFGRAIEKLRENLSLSTVRNTFVFEISYLSKDPEEAAAVANTAAEMFVEYSSIANRKEGRRNREFIEIQLKEAKEEMVEVRQALREFKEHNRSILFDEEATKKIEIVSDLETTLAKTAAKLSGLLNQYMPEHPEVQKLEGEKEHLLSSITKHKNELTDFPAKEYQLATLKLDLEVAKAKYELIKKEYEEAKIRETISIKEIRIVSPATVPSIPIKPIKLYYAGAGFIMSLIIGIGFAFFLESMDTRLKTIKNVEQILQLPVLTTIPVIKKYNSTKNSKTSWKGL